MWMPEYYLAAVMLIALCVYMLTAGADFGGGILDMLCLGKRALKQRALIAEHLAPMWEANHVWLILIIVLMFVCFPSVFSTMSIVLHIPITILLIGIVLRGSAFIFRTHDAESNQKRWSLLFSIGSILAPLMLGIALGSVASGLIPVLPSPLEGVGFLFEAYFIDPWFKPFPILTGLLTLCLCALLSSLYLLGRAPEPALRQDFRIRAFGFAISTGLLAFGALWASKRGAMQLHDALLYQTWSLGFHILTGLAALAVFIALYFKYDQTAKFAGMIQVVCMIGGWALGQFPYMIVDTHTILDSAASHAILNPVLVALGVGSIALVPSFIWLYWVFKPSAR